MFFFFSFGLAGIAIGALIAYFFSTAVVIVLSIAFALYVWNELRDKPGVRRNSGTLGAVMIAGLFSIGFYLGLWVTWFFVPGNSTFSWSWTEPILTWLKQVILR